MKKLILSALSLTFILSAAFFASGCGKKHEHKYTVTVIEPTCSSQGYTEHVCSCGKKYEDNFVEPIDHTQGSPTYTATVNATDATKGVLREITSCKFCSTVLSENDYNVSLPELTFSYDGKPHESKIAGDKLPDGIDAVYLYSTDVSFDDELPGGIISAGDYAVAATLSKDGAPIDLGFCLISKLRINKDGKYHEVTFCFDDLPTNNVSIAVKDGYTIDEDKMPAIPEKTGYDGEWIYDGDEIYEDTSISVLYTPIEYSIKYVLDGAENNPRNPSYYTYESGTISLYAPESVTGYTFQGWYTTPNFEPQSRVSVISSGSSGNLTLYAKFLKYRVEAADGFTFDYKNYDYPALIQTVSSSRTSIALSTTIQVSKGCTWTLSRDIEGFELIKTKNMSLVEGHNIAYVTVWYDEEYNVVYYLDIYRLGHRSYAYYADGEVYCESATVEEQTYLSAPEAPSKTGYTFNGWYAYNLPDSSEDFDPSLPVIGTTAATFPYRLDENVVFYAIFTPNVYTATFDVNGGKPLASETQNVTYDTPFIPAAAKRDGYTFVGWKDDEGNVFKSLAQWKYDYPVTFTAQWLLNTYEIIYNLNGGTNNKNNPATYTIESDTVTLVTPARTAYSFAGWFTDRNFTNEITEIAAGSFGNKTVYAKWTPVVYDIIYELDGGTNSENNPATYTVETPTIEFAAPSKTGYTFNGWYAEKDFSGDNVTELPQSSYGNVTLYAKWTANKYTITYLDTKLITGTKNTFVYAKGETYVQSVTYDKNYDLINYERTGYAKTGWFNGDENFDGGIWNLTNDVTLYADWQIVTYNITYVLNGGDTIGENPTEYTIESQDITLADPTGKHTFIGWYKDEALKEKITVITNRSFGDITLYADWQHETATDWVIDKAPTCTNTGLRHKVCSVCGVNYNYETIATVPTAHVRGEEVKENVVDPTCTKDGSYDVVVYCTKCNKELSRNTYAIPIVDHDLDENNVCTICGKSSSDGLTFTLKGDVYELTSIGTCTDINVLIPNTYQNKAVTSIGSRAFENCSTLIRITIPDSVTSIGNYAFSGCSGLTSITIPDSVISIGGLAFSGCGGLTSIVVDNDNKYFTSIDGNLYNKDKTKLIQYAVGKTDVSFIIPDSVTFIGYYAFYGCSSLTSIAIPDGVTSISESAFKYCSILTSITIPDGVTSIGNSAFYGCSSLTSITIPDRVTSIGEYAFRDCSSLTSITIPDSVTSIGDCAFYDCSSLTSVIWNAENCTKAGTFYGTIFYNCSKLLSITIGENVKTIPDCAFYYCSSLTSVIIGNGVTSIGDSAFKNCSGLTSITIPDSVTSIGGRAFEGCSSLTSITISDGVTSIGEYAFYGCSSLTSITIPDSVTSIGEWAFYRCSGLTSITIPDGVTSIGGSALRDCSSLTSITIPDSVTSIGDYALFYGCSSLTSVTIPNSVTSIGGHEFDGCSSLTSITIPDSVTSIGVGAFYGCNSLTSIIIPDGVTSIDNSAFKGCNSLTNVIWNAENCTRAGDVEFPIFYGCPISSVTVGENVKTIPPCAFYDRSSLTSVTIGNSVTSIGDYAFSGCSSLTSIIIPDSVTSIGGGAFSGCDLLAYNEYDNAYYLGSDTNKYVVLIKAKTTSIASCNINDSCKIIYNSAFKECSGLTSVTISNGVTSIGRTAFSGCSGLTSVTIGNGVISIGDSAFEGCNSLTSVIWNAENCISAGSWNSPIFFGCSKLSNITIGEDVKSIPGAMFSRCSGLTNITIPNSVTSIGYRAFYECSSLTSITIGNSVSFIGEYAFYGCSSLKTVFYKGTAEQWSKISIRNANTNLTNVARYYYSESEPALSSDGTAYDGNYWHYDTDGVTPVIWKKEN